jgi:hypothetical protein
MGAKYEPFQEVEIETMTSSFTESFVRASWCKCSEFTGRDVKVELPPRTEGIVGVFQVERTVFKV